MIDQAAAEKALWWIKDNSGKLAEARATRVYMEQWVKTVKATIQLEFGTMSAAASEIAALASPKYLAALQAYRDAVQADEAMRWQATAAEAQIEAWRSQEATRRAEGRATQ